MAQYIEAIFPSPYRGGVSRRTYLSRSSVPRSDLNIIAFRLVNAEVSDNKLVKYLQQPGAYNFVGTVTTVRDIRQRKLASLSGLSCFLLDADALLKRKIGHSFARKDSLSGQFQSDPDRRVILYDEKKLRFLPYEDGMTVLSRRPAFNADTTVSMLPALQAQ